jgi:predicted amidohydrolase YtcJ
MHPLAPSDEAGEGASCDADLVVVGARAMTLDPRRPTAEAIAVRGQRILAVGTDQQIHTHIGPRTVVVDGAGGIAVPAFHDAHCHFLSYARSRSWVDCRGARRLADIAAALRLAARRAPADAWIRAYGYDDAALVDGREPDRRDLDAAVPDRPVRLQHRTLHLDILNSIALRALGLGELIDPRIEREATNGEPTGRIYHGAELLHRAGPLGTADDLARDVRAACERLLSRGITSIQDASVTNGPAEWALFHLLAAQGDLRVRFFMMWGGAHWRERDGVDPECDLVRHGPVKLMVEERTSDPADIRASVCAATRAGHAVALHAVSEAEVAIALAALRDAPPPRGRGPNRIEHGAVICDDWLEDLRSTGAMVVGQPALVYERGGRYRDAYAPECHGWLHRARSLLQSGIGYAASSDAPVTEPDPLLSMAAARTRATRDGSVLGQGEALTAKQALAAWTLGSARAVGAQQELGILRPGRRADIAILDPSALDSLALDAERTVRATIMNGKVVWQRG